MQFSSDLEIREQLARYLAREISLQDFEDWFAPRAWNIHEATSPALQELVSEIELLLAEFSNGDWTEKELRRMLSPLVATYKVSIAPIFQTATSSKVFINEATFRVVPHPHLSSDT